MCLAPKIPKPTPAPTLQAAQAPEGLATGERAAERQRRRLGFAASLLTGAGGMGAPQTAVASAAPVTGA